MVKRRKVIPHTCLFCGRTFSRYRSLQHHIHLHIGECPYPCLECDIWFKSSDQLWNHKKTVHEGIKWRCQPCDKEFNSSSSLLRHRKRTHPGGHDKKVQNGGQRKKMKGVVVRKPVVKVKSSFKVQNVIEKRTTDLPIKEELLFKIDLNLEPRQGRAWDPSFFLHMNRYVPSDDQEELSFKTPNDNEMIAVTKTPILESSCMDDRMEKGADITGNEQSVGGEVPPKDVPMELDGSSSQFQCKKCGKVLASQRSFQAHQKIADCVLFQRVRETPPTSNLYICYFCKYNFGERRSNLVRHIASVHRYDEGGVTPDGGTRRKFIDFSCGFCGFKSDIKKDLQMHIIINHNELLGVAKDC